MSALLKSKKASRTFCSKSSLIPAGCPVVGATTAAPPVTVTRAVAVAVPPGPFAVATYVVDSVGVTGVEPSTATLPTLGSMLTSVALVDDHVRLTLAPGLTVEGDAFNVIVGCPVGAGWSGPAAPKRHAFCSRQRWRQLRPRITIEASLH